MCLNSLKSHLFFTFGHSDLLEKSKNVRKKPTRTIPEKLVGEITNRDEMIFPRYQIMMNCWQNEPEARPSFTALTKQLKDMENQHKVRLLVVNKKIIIIK